MTTAEPGRLTDDQAADLAKLRADARGSGDWGDFVDAVMARSAAGVTVARIAAAAGVWGEPDPPGLPRPRPPAAQGASYRVGHRQGSRRHARGSAQRLAAAWRAGEAAGVTRTVGWDRLWHLDALPDWWAAQPAGRVTAAAARRAERDERIRELAAGGAGLVEIAQAVGVSTATARRALSSDR